MLAGRRPYPPTWTGPWPAIGRTSVQSIRSPRTPAWSPTPAWPCVPDTARPDGGRSGSSGRSIRRWFRLVSTVLYPSSRPACGRPPPVAALAPATTRRSPWNRLALPLGVAHRAAGRHSAVTATGLGRQQPPGRPGANPLRQQLPMRSMSAGRLARLSGVAGHGLMQVAEGLLDAGVDVVGTVGAVLACSRWLGR
jgi:hypothetical protein